MRYFLNKLFSHLFKCHESVRLLRQHQTLENEQKGCEESQEVNELGQICPLQSALIFSILSHPCSSMVYYHLFDVFLH